MPWNNPMEHNFGGFAIQQGDVGKEAQCLCLYANYHKIPRKFFIKPSDVPVDWVAYGNVDWCDKVLGKTVVPDYYPDFLSNWVKRKIWRQEKWPYGSRVFIKPSDAHKRFTGFVTNGTWKGKKRGPYWCSEIVKFTNEWRYYISWGELKSANWCCGDNESPAPKLEIDWPKDFCGCVDFGTYENGEIALVESNSPYACGWYGTLNDYEVYTKWIIEGWKYSRNNIDKNT